MTRLPSSGQPQFGQMNQMDLGVEFLRQVRDVLARYPCRSLIRLRTILCEARRASTRIYSTGTVPQCAYRQWRNEKPGAKTLWARHNSMTRVDIAWIKVRIDGFFLHCANVR